MAKAESIPALSATGRLGAAHGLEARRRRAGLLLVAPALVVLTLVVLYPIVRTAALSFQNAQLSAGELGTSWAGLDNYRRMGSDEAFATAARNSAFFTVAEVVLVVGLALAAALLLDHPRGRSPFFRTILLVPWAIAPVANAVLWKWIYNANYGVLNAALVGLGAVERPVNWLGDPNLALRMLLLADVWKSIPFIALLLLAGLQNIPAYLYKAAQLDGANAWQRFRFVTLPGLRTPLTLAVVLQTIWSFKVFDLIFVLTKAGPADATLLLNFLAYRVSFNFLDFGYGAAIANVIFVIMFVLALVVIRAMKPGAPRRTLTPGPSPAAAGEGRAAAAALDRAPLAHRNGREVGGEGNPRLRRARRTLSIWAVRLGLAVFTFWTLAPIVWMIVSSFLRQRALSSRPPDLRPESWTFGNYAKVLATGQGLVPALLNSTIVALGTTLIALALGAAAAYALARLGVPGGNRIALLVLATQMFPGIVIVIPLFIVLSRLGMIDTYPGLIAVYLSFVLPVAIWILKGFFEAIPPALEKAAAVDGASVLQTFRLVVLPISLPPLFAAAIFAFIESWNEFLFAVILTRTQTKTVPIAISEFAGQYQTQVGQMLAAAALACVPVVVLAIIFRRSILLGFAEGAIKG
jgi:ABC-type sugar transport system permease subunit